MKSSMFGVGRGLALPRLAVRNISTHSMNREYNSLHSIRSPKPRKSKLPAVHIPRGTSPMSRRY